MKTISTLIAEFQEQYKKEQEERLMTLRNLVEVHGYDKVSEATGYKISTLSLVMGNGKVPLSDERVRQAVYVFSNLE